MLVRTDYIQYFRQYNTTMSDLIYYVQFTSFFKIHVYVHYHATLHVFGSYVRCTVCKYIPI